LAGWRGNIHAEIAYIAFFQHLTLDTIADLLSRVYGCIARYVGS
jgi:hypothetical protein